jgi:carboxymethylenebutenolidase
LDRASKSTDGARPSENVLLGQALRVPIARPPGIAVGAGRLAALCTASQPCILTLVAERGLVLQDRPGASLTSIVSEDFMRRAFVLAVVCGLSVSSAMGQDWAKAKLDKSTRHGEYVEFKAGRRNLQAFVTYPEVAHKATTVLVVYEIFGLTDWAKLAVDEFAAAGYIAIAPDFLSGSGNSGEARQAVSRLPEEQVMTDLDAAFKYAKSLPASNGKVVVAGFCWGGGMAFSYAAHRKDLSAAFVFYGRPPEQRQISELHCPVYGFYAEKDARITVTVDQTKKFAENAGKKYEPVIYRGAGHGFMRMGEQASPLPDNAKARNEAWRRLKEILPKV